MRDAIYVAHRDKVNDADTSPRKSRNMMSQPLLANSSDADDSVYSFPSPQWVSVIGRSAHWKFDTKTLISISSTVKQQMENRQYDVES